MSSNVAKLTFHGKTVEFPIYSGTLGQDVIDIRKLGNEGIFAFDQGFYSTAACESKITFVDGNQGSLLYRGYPIDQLAEQCDYLEVCHLLLKGELPNITDYLNLKQTIGEYSLLHEQMRNFFNGFRRDAHPMAVMVGIVGALSAFHHNQLDYTQPEAQELAAMHLIAKMPAIAAWSYRYASGQPFIYPRSDLSYAENFLYMMFARSPDEDYQPDPVLSQAMDKIFTLHADHEQNASTTTVRVAGSTGANPFACISAGISALWGPAHGGANEACLRMLQEIGDESRIDQYIKRAKDPNDPFRLMGFGHRIYKNYDPRAKVMEHTCHQVLELVKHQNDPLLRLAMKLEKIALEDEYFISRKLYPNVDFYSGLTLNAIGIPGNMFTVIFALARTVGWIAHWQEMVNDPNQKLARPRQWYTGQQPRNVVKTESHK